MKTETQPCDIMWKAEIRKKWQAHQRWRGAYEQEVNVFTWTMPETKRELSLHRQAGGSPRGAERQKIANQLCLLIKLWSYHINNLSLWEFLTKIFPNQWRHTFWSSLSHHRRIQVPKPSLSGDKFVSGGPGLPTQGPRHTKFPVRYCLQPTAGLNPHRGWH